MKKNKKNQSKKEESKSQQISIPKQIYLGNDLATILKEAKPLFETRKGYGWDCGLKNEVEDIISVYEYKGKLYVITLDGCDCPIFEYSDETRNKVREEAIKWLKKQPQTQGKLKE